MMIKPVRLSLPALKILRVFLNSGEPMYGFELLARTRVKSGVLYPILWRFEGSGILASRTEDIDPRQEGRPRRTYYTFTRPGRQFAQEKLRELSPRRY